MRLSQQVYLETIRESHRIPWPSNRLKKSKQVRIWTLSDLHKTYDFLRFSLGVLEYQVSSVEVLKPRTGMPASRSGSRSNPGFGRNMEKRHFCMEIHGHSIDFPPAASCSVSPAENPDMAEVHPRWNLWISDFMLYRIYVVTTLRDLFPLLSL